MEARSSRRQVIAQAATAGAVLTSVALVPALAAHASAPATASPAAGKGPIALTTLSIPKIGLNKTVYDGVDDRTLASGPGHAMWSVAPGRAGHCLLMGHRTVHGAPFNRLNALKKGDKVTLGSTTYTVVKWEVLPVSKPKAIWNWAGSGGKRLSLVACSKPDGSPTSTAFRICVRCQA